MPGDRPGILCVSHLTWDHVWQRPQQILSRIAARIPVLYVSEPEIRPGPPGSARLEMIADRGGLTALRAICPAAEEPARWRARFLGLLAGLLVGRRWVEPGPGGLEARRPLVLWLYTPGPHYIADRLPAASIVYDVMDDLAGFRGAAPDLRERHDILLRRSDLVFAGGRSLHAALRDRGAPAHLFPSGVDPAHFAPALDPAVPPAPEVAALPRPVLGYVGVIDERIDLDLLAAVARARPSWSIALVGPTAKIDESSLPRLPNIHRLGKRPYSALPAILKGFDVCLMPFALNDATRSISPTKGPEYMAAGRPIVSTPVPDVVAAWSDVVRIGRTPGEFIARVEAALAETPGEREARAARAEAIVRAGTWDRIAGEMMRLVEADLDAKRAAARSR